MYYQYSSWLDVQEKFESGHVVSAFLLKMDDGEHLVVAFGSHRRSGLVSLAKITQVDGKKDIASLGLAYTTYVMSLEKDCMVDVSLEKIEQQTTSHCLLLPYRLPNKSFDKQFAIVYDNCNTGSLDRTKSKVEPCKNVLKKLIVKVIK